MKEENYTHELVMKLMYKLESLIKFLSSDEYQKSAKTMLIVPSLQFLPIFIFIGLAFYFAKNTGDAIHTLKKALMFFIKIFATQAKKTLFKEVKTVKIEKNK